MKRNDYDMTLVKSMVLACCALHNLCEDYRDICNFLEMSESIMPDTSRAVADAQKGSGKKM